MTQLLRLEWRVKGFVFEGAAEGLWTRRDEHSEGKTPSFPLRARLIRRSKVYDLGMDV